MSIAFKVTEPPTESPVQRGTAATAARPHLMRFYFTLEREGTPVDAGGFVEATSPASAVRYIECTLAAGADVIIVRTTRIPVSVYYVIGLSDSPTARSLPPPSNSGASPADQHHR